MERELSKSIWSAVHFPEGHLAMQAIGAAVKGRTPTPELLASLVSEYRNAIPDHEVRIIYRPKESHRHRAIYEVEIVGKRLNCGWGLTTGQLRDALNSVCPDHKIKLS